MTNHTRQNSQASRLIYACLLGLGLAASECRAFNPPNFSFCNSVLTQHENGTWVMWNRSLSGMSTSAWSQNLSSSALVTPRRLRSIDTLFATSANGLPTAKRIYCRGDKAFASLSNGKLVAWGENGYGILGLGDTLDRTSPVQVPLLPAAVKDISIGSYHAAAILNDGSVWTWGTNAHGQLGDGSIVGVRTSPAAIPSLYGAKSITSDTSHSLAVMSDGTVRAWGRNYYGQLGLGDRTNYSTPQTVAGLTNVTDVKTTDYFSIALKKDGSVWAWGNNNYGELGDGGGTNADSLTPKLVTGLAEIKKITTNGAQTGFALDTQGRVWGWGYNLSEVLGANNANCNYRCVPRQIAGLPQGVVDIHAAGDVAFAVMPDGTIYAWGSNNAAAMGLGRLDYSSPPDSFALPQLVRQGVTHSDLDRDYVSDIVFRNSITGEIWAWGMKDLAVDSSASIGIVSSDWKIVGIADADGDGKDDFYWRNKSNGGNAIWHMDGRSVKSSISMPTIGDQSWQVAAIADLNSDGRGDYIWRNASAGLWAVWLMDANGLLDSRVYGGAPSSWEIRGVADFTGDGKADIIWRESTTGAVAIYRMNGTTLSGASFLAGGLSEWDVVGVTDTDRDGRAEILFRYYTGAALAEVHLASDGTSISTTSTRFLPAAGGAWNIAAIGDFDGDTHQDFLWRNPSGELVIWKLENLVLPGVNEIEKARSVRFLGNPGAVWEVIGK